MWNNNSNSNSDDGTRGFLTPPPKWKSPELERKSSYPQSAPKADLFHVIHKVPAGNSPYVRAKHVQLIDKDPSKAISLFWAAINSGDRVDSALKDMAVVMKQLNRSDEAIEAIKSFRHLCPSESQESIDNILIELYKRSGRIEEEIKLLELKLKDVEEGIAFGGKKSKIARSQGKKVQITIEKEYSRLLGNLAWSHMQLKNYKSAEEYYRKALSLEPDKNKQSNLAICLMHMNKITEAKFLIQSIKASDRRQMDDSCTKSFERATQMLAELESHVTWKSKEQQEKMCEQMPRSFTSDGHNKRNGHVRTHPSSFSAAGTPDEFFTQPRRFSCSLNEHNWFTKDSASACSRRLLFEKTTNNENVQSVAKDNSNKLISGKEMNKVSQTSGQVLYRPWRNGVNMKTESTLQPHWDKWKKNSLDTWRNNENVQSVVNDNLNKLISDKEMNNESHLSEQVLYSPWRNDAKMKDESTLQPDCDKWKRNSSENDGTDKISPELSNSPPQPLADNTSARTCSEDGVKDYLNSSLISGDTLTLTDTTEPPLESTNFKPLDLSACKSKKSWADMVEEDELGFQFYETPIKYCDGNENVDLNIINLDKSFESLCMSEGYHTQPGPAVKRSLYFGQQDRNENCSSRFQGKDFNFGSLPPIGDIANHTPVKLLRRNRLQVFQDITPETPKP